MPLDAVAISWASVSVNAPKCLDLLQGYQTDNFFFAFTEYIQLLSWDLLANICKRNGIY